MHCGRECASMRSGNWRHDNVASTAPGMPTGSTAMPAASCCKWYAQIICPAPVTSHRL